jgi:hypothetical protein
VALQAVAEVVPVPACDEVPGAPDWLLGTFLLGRRWSRTSISAAACAAAALALARRPGGGRPRDGVAGLRVAGVGEVVELDPALPAGPGGLGAGAGGHAALRARRARAAALRRELARPAPPPRGGA